MWLLSLLAEANVPGSLTTFTPSKVRTFETLASAFVCRAQAYARGRPLASEPHGHPGICSTCRGAGNWRDFMGASLIGSPHKKLETMVRQGDAFNQGSRPTRMSHKERPELFAPTGKLCGMCFGGTRGTFAALQGNRRGTDCPAALRN